MTGHAASWLGERSGRKCAVMRHRVATPLLVGWLGLILAGCTTVPAIGRPPNCSEHFGRAVFALFTLGLSEAILDCPSANTASVNTVTDPRYVDDANEHRQKAESGDPNGQYSLGLDFKYGLGMSRDPVEAVKWFQKAADQGLRMAQRYMGKAYESGDGVQQNYVEADKWYLLAETGGLALAVVDRESIEKRMTQAQIDEAHKRAHEWKPAEHGNDRNGGSSV